jgi:HME family heavy-metal exporter
VNGRVVSEVLDGQRRFDILVRLDEAYRNRPALLAQVPIDGPAGAKIPVGAVAEVRPALGPNQILHENTQRRMVVQCNIAGRDLGSAVAEIRQAISDKVRLDRGYFVTYGGQFESQERATRLIALLSVAVAAAIFLILYGHFRSGRVVLQIMANIPLAIIGGVIATLLTGGTISVASLIGFITLAGITARNGIMMVSHYLHLVAYEGENFDLRMIVRGSLERLVPVLMTALTTGLALLPLALAGGAPGKEILQPVAVVILGGLISSTLLDQAVTPALFYRFGRPVCERILAKRPELAEGELAAATEDLSIRTR